MPEEFKIGCKRPDIKKQKSIEHTNSDIFPKKEDVDMLKVGKTAPDFTAPSYFQGKFMSVNLNEYKGKWVLLCFYPGDFTFV